MSNPRLVGEFFERASRHAQPKNLGGECVDFRLPLVADGAHAPADRAEWRPLEDMADLSTCRLEAGLLRVQAGLCSLAQPVVLGPQGFELVDDFLTVHCKDLLKIESTEGGSQTAELAEQRAEGQRTDGDGEADESHGSGTRLDCATGRLGQFRPDGLVVVGEQLLAGGNPACLRNRSEADQLVVGDAIGILPPRNRGRLNADKRGDGEGSAKDFDEFDGIHD